MGAHNSISKSSSHVLLFAFLAVPVIGFLAPRFMAYWPAVIGLFSMLYFAGYKRQIPKMDWNLMALIFAPAVLGAISLLWAQSVDASLERVEKMSLVLLGGALFITCLQYYKEVDIDRYLKYLPWVVSSFALLISAELVLDMRIYRLTHGIEDLMVKINPSSYNRASIVVLVVGLISMMLSYKHKRWGGFLAVLLSMSVMNYLSESQSLQLGFMIGVIGFFVFPYKAKWSWLVVWTLIAALTVCAPLIVQWVFQYAQSLDQIAFFEQGSAGPRLEIWDYVSRYAMERPYLGYGIEVTRTIEDFDSAEIFQSGTSILHPHNFAIQFWIEFGIVGVLALLSYFGVLFYRMRLSFVSGKAGYLFFPIFITLLSIASTGYGIWQSWWLGLILMSVVMVKYLNQPNKKAT